MKNSIFFLLLSVFFFQSLLAENLNIQSSKISIDKKTKLTIFKDNVIAKDEKNNVFKTNYAEYNKDLKLLESKGDTTIQTSEGFLISGKNSGSNS